MNNQEESFDDFIDRIDNDYERDFKDLDYHIEITNKYNDDRPAGFYHILVIKISGVTAFLLALFYVSFQSLLDYANGRPIAISQLETIALISLAFYNAGIFGRDIVGWLDSVLRQTNYRLNRRLVRRNMRKELNCTKTRRSHRRRAKCN